MRTVHSGAASCVCMKAAALSTSVLAEIKLTCLARNVYGPSEVTCALMQSRYFL